MEWTENIIIADADYVDNVAFNLTVNFERMIGRRIPPADMARWVECIALDGGMRPTSTIGSAPDACPITTQVVLIHDDGQQRMENFMPGDYAELHGKAFTGNLGEFMFCCTSPSGITTKAALLKETLELACQTAEVRRIMVVPGEDGIDDVRRVLRHSLSKLGHSSLEKQREQGLDITVFTMQPVAGGRDFSQEMLGYSLMAALGVKSSELNPESQG